MENIRERIKSDEIDKTVNAEKQNRHIRDNSGYIKGRSYLLDGVSAQRLVDTYHGTGREAFTGDGRWKNKETITLDKIIGVNIDPTTGEETYTNKFVIHYSKTGTHVVPSRGRLQL
ncbi:MAG: polymorphic toxin type 50 domain-containing protein [Defluviitaleaceae bacterium]|nr:polymorphic toxin type 50 domain-containing protein [Defluviitaleaceae bacterium]